jgi:hypothetical protein
MTEMTHTLTFKYSPDDIVALIKADIAKRTAAKPLGESIVYFSIDAKEDPGDWRAEYPVCYVLGGATATVKVSE